MAEAKIDDFTKQAKQRYDELVKKLETAQAEVDKLKEQVKPLKSYLEAAGILEKPKRGRKKKDEAPQ